jgi:diguanylate cyclase (GGDEF)-like protein/PAS domain S-box-containing protein
VTTSQNLRSIVLGSRALRITLLYAILAAAWIFASDALLGLFVTEPRVFAAIGMAKGWVFVAITAALLYHVIKSTPSSAPQEAADRERLAESAPEELVAFSIWPPLIIFLVFVAAISVTGFVVYGRIARAARTHAEQTLGAIAELKVRQIRDWMDERHRNAEHAGDEEMAGETGAWLARGAPEDETARHLRARLASLQSQGRWSTIFVVDRRGDIRLALGPGDGYSLMPGARARALAAMQANEIAFWDFHSERELGDSHIEFGFMAPLSVESGAAARVVGAVVMDMEPATYLYPLIQSWPLPSRSGETLLVRRDGDSVLYLNELRHSKATALILRLPLASSKNLVAAKAILGARGSIEGVDYRGVPVLARAEAVPQSPWILISKLDLEEVNGPLAQTARLVAMLGMVLVLGAGLTTMFWLRQQRANALLRHYRAERERTVLTKHLDYLTRYANDMILLIDDTGGILDANERAVGAYGYTREELLESNVKILRTPESLQSFDDQWTAAQLQGGVVFETVHRRKDGSTFPVEVSSRAIEAKGTTLRQSIIRDISERKQDERKIIRLSNLYAALSQINQAIVRGKQRDGLFEEICRVSVEFGRLQFAWVGLVDEDTGMVNPVAHYGRDGGYIDEIRVTTDPDQATGRGPIGVAIRQRTSMVINDFFADPSTMPWREAATRAGFRAVAACPLVSGDRVIGALGVYADEAGFFDAETIALLTEMTDDVSFALQSLEKEERRRAAEDALRESEEKYRLLFSNEQDAIVVFDADTTSIVETNEAFLRLSGYSEDDSRKLHIGDLSSDMEASNRSIRTVREQGVDRVDARRLRRKDGTEILIEIGLNSFVWRGRRLVSAILRDITERKKAEESALLWSKVLEDSAEGIMITDADRKILTVNKAFTTLTGYTPEEVIGGDPKILSSGRHDAAFFHVMWRTIRLSDRWQGEIWNRRKNGEVYLEWLSVTAVRNAEGVLTHYVGIFSDITERKESADRIEFLASHDSLTALPNRLLMNDLVRQSVAAARRKGSMLALLFLDLDRFKTINDSLGHSIGDDLLQHVAVRLTDSVREGDTVARLGGDEFLIMLPELSRSQDAAVVAEKIVAAMRAHIVIEEHELGITASIGISVYPHDGADVSALIKNADAAMYHAKERGRNNYQFFTPDMNARAFEALSMEMSLRGALERDEFTLHYQPQVQTDTGLLIGAEALIRWQHRDLGSVPPSRFIPIAEEHGLIVPIGEWVLRVACRQVRQWLDEGLPAVPVAVNMSAVQFRQSDLAARVAAILEESGVAPRYLELELTESILMRDAEQAIAVLLELSNMGVSLSIDDFGTGYSSLSYLRRFPIHKLKIDQSFVSDIPENLDAAAIATAIIGMGRSLKLRVVAEGVETEQQLTFLRGQQCDELQGYYIGRPMETDRFSALLRKGGPLVTPAAEKSGLRLGIH